MFRSLLKTSWRNFTRGKSFSIINTTGLAIGMAGAIVILLWVENEISFDKFHNNKDNLYQVYGLTSIDEHPNAIPVVAQPLGPALKQTFPEVEAQTRVKDLNRFLLTANNKSLSGISGSIVDPSFLQMFSFPLKEGNISSQLKDIYSITITESLAKKLFGEADALGRTIKIDSVDQFTITGVLKNLPSNTRFDFEYLLPFDYLKKLGAGYINHSWFSNNTATYLLLKPMTKLEALLGKIKKFSQEKTGKNDLWTHFLFPLSDWHLYSDFEDGRPVGGRIETVRVFATIAAFILLIACINFMNLSTARSEKRAKEVGIRKVVGAERSLLIGQFIGEAFLTTFIAGVIALVTVVTVLPSFNNLTNSRLSIPYDKIYFWIYWLGFIGLTSLLAGSYPAFYLSSFKPISIFKKQFKNTNAAVSSRQALVVLQFTIAIVLIISTIVVRNQLEFGQNRDKGYSNNNLMHVDFTGNIERSYDLIKQDLISSGTAAFVTKNMIDITNGGAHAWGLRWPGEIPKDTNTTITLFSADADWVNTAGLHLLAGRDIDIYRYPADSSSVVLNETAVNLMNLKNPLEQTILMKPNNKPLRIVGVVKDYIIGSPYEAVPPTVIMGPDSWFNTMHIRFSSSRPIKENLAKAEEIFRKYNPAYPFDYGFVDLEYAKQFNDEQRTKTMAGLFATLAIFISCLGLFGLSAFVAESRVKEIGVRKVMGASVTSITTLLSVDFIKLVIVSIFIATPVAWYAMNIWLKEYTYRIQLSLTIFMIAGLMAIMIALITVSFQALKAATANPVKSLRAE